MRRLNLMLVAILLTLVAGCALKNPMESQSTENVEITIKTLCASADTSVVADVLIDGVKYGSTDSIGTLEIIITTGQHSFEIRATGFLRASKVIEIKESGLIIPFYLNKQIPGQNSNPVPLLEIDPPFATSIPATFNFDASGSYDPDGDQITYRIHFVDGTNLNGQQTSRTISEYGYYSGQLIVEDGKGGSGSYPFMLSVVDTTKPVIPAICWADSSFGDVAVWSNNITATFQTQNPSGNFRLFVKVRFSSAAQKQKEENAILQWNGGDALNQSPIFDDQVEVESDHTIWIALQGNTSWSVNEDQQWTLTRMNLNGTNSVHVLGVKGVSP